MIMFDLDGTLLRSHGASKRCMETAGKQIFGERFSLDGQERDGVTDAELAFRAAMAVGYDVTVEQLEAFRRRYCVYLSRLARVEPTLQAKSSLLWLMDAGVLLACVTGNYEWAARIKMDYAKLGTFWYATGVFGDFMQTRTQQLLRCMAAVRRTEGCVFVCDTPRDIEAAHEASCKALAVCTGHYGADALRSADMVVPALSSPEFMEAVERWTR